MQSYANKSGMRRQGMMPDDFPITDTELGFREAMHLSPDEDTGPLVYADWLAEHNRPHAEARLRWWVKTRRHLRTVVFHESVTRSNEIGMGNEYQHVDPDRLDALLRVASEFARVKPEWVQRLVLVELVRQLGKRYDLVAYRPGTAYIGLRSRPQDSYERDLQRRITILTQLPRAEVKFTDGDLDDLKAGKKLGKLADSAFAQLFAMFTRQIDLCLETSEQFALHLASVRERQDARSTLKESEVRYLYATSRDEFMPRRVQAAYRCANNSLHGGTAASVLADLSLALVQYTPLASQGAVTAEINALALAAISNVRDIANAESPTKRLS